MNDLGTRLTELSERGEHLGAEELRQRVMLELAHDGVRARYAVPGWVVALAVALIAVVVIGTPLILFRGSDGSTEPQGPTVETSSTVTGVDQIVERVVLAPVEGIDPVTISMPIGDFEFVTMELPDSRAFEFPFHATVATPYGPVSGDDSRLWWSADYVTWNTTSAAGVSGDILLVDGDIVVLSHSGATRSAWNGDRWIEGQRIDVPGPIDWIAFGPHGVVAANSTTVYYSADGADFVEAERGPDLANFWASRVDPNDEEFAEAARMDCRGTFGATHGQIRTVVATDSGFVAFTSAAHPVDAVCAPLLWFSTDGTTWDLISPDSPFGEAEVNTLSIAERDGRFVAIGAVEAAMQGFVWVSDDALTWRQADLELAYPLMVDAGELGWALIGAEALPQAASDFALWFSADGQQWDGPHPLPDGLRLGSLVPEIVVGADTIFGVGFEEQVFVIGRLQED